MTVDPYYVLGLDPGISSCGFCLIDKANGKVLEMGSRLFNAPQEPKNKLSLAKKRRGQRSVRRNIKRTRDRRTHILRVLKQEGIVPEDAEKNWMQPRKGERNILELRVAGLDEQLSPREWAQILYSFGGHRGYIPKGKSFMEADSGDDDDGKVKDAIKHNVAVMEEHGYRTVGEMFYAQNRYRNKLGNYDRCVLHDQILDEINLLFERQSSFGNAATSDEFKKAYLDNLNWLKSTEEYDKKVYSTVGFCSYFPDEKRAARASVTSEMLRAHERLAHLVIVDETGKEHRLPLDLRMELVGILFSEAPIKGNVNCKVTYSSIRKKMDKYGMGARCAFKGISLDDEGKEIFEPKALCAYRKVKMNPDLLRRMREDWDLGDAIGEALTFASSQSSLIERLEEFGIEDDVIDEVLKMPVDSKVFKGYGSRSQKAIHMLLGAFEDPSIKTLYDAEKAVGLADLRLSDTSERSGLLPPFKDFDPTCKNPVVLRSLGQMRRIINAIIKIYGVPHEVHIELGRELKHSVKEKKLISKRNRENENENKQAAKDIAAIKGIDPNDVTGKEIQKYRLWNEQKNLDVYTGEPIDVERLVKDTSYCQIDHVLPYSRTSENSIMNRVLVLSKNNQMKRERSPYEWMTSGEDKAPSWSEFQARIQNSGLPQKKKDFLLEQNLDEKESGFIQRNLNDTRYMSRSVKEYVESSLEFPEVEGKKQHVFAVAGGATAYLRRQLGLNMGAENTKDRSDDRHHAVDAAVIAACDAGTVQRIAKASAKKKLLPPDEYDAQFVEAQPWPDFAKDVLKAYEVVIPTRMADHGVTGGVYKETLYHLEEIRDDGKVALTYHKDQKPATETSGNYQIMDETNGVRLVTGLAFLRLWHDPDAKKGKGRWYGEPVYYIDIPKIQAGTYVPRYMKAHSSRDAWPEVPESAMVEEPLVVYPGDVVSIGGNLVRLSTLNIANANWELLNLLGVKLGTVKTIGRLTNEDEIRVVQEDVLGRCYYDLSKC